MAAGNTGPKAQTRRKPSALRELLASEAAGGLLLMGVAVLAMLIANSPFADAYFHALHLYLAGLSLQHWINDGLMAIFFLLVGLEIKREVLDGQLASWPRRVLPGICALGGMVAPALIYVAINRTTPDRLNGWAIPAATDIAFALGVLALLGRRVPASLKVFLAALAILDDLGAVLIIAIFYTADLSLPMLAAALAGIALLVVLGRLGVTQLWPFLAIGAVVWFFVLKSGIHATLAGVAVAMTVPLRRSPGSPDDAASPLHRLEHGLHPWVAFLIVPVFGFANAGVSLKGMGLDTLLAPVPLGVAAGLFAGKQIGILLTGAVCVAAGWAQLPAKATWRQFYGVALLCGIGFTMSLFIGALAFPDRPDVVDETRIGVMVGSVLSMIAGYALLRLAPAAREDARLPA